MATTQPLLEAAALIADTEAEMLRLVGDHDPSTAGVYEMIRYHLGLDGSGAPAGKRMRPLLGLLAYASIAGDHRPALPGAAALAPGPTAPGAPERRPSSGPTTSAPATTTSRTPIASAGIVPRSGPGTASPRR